MTNTRPPVRDLTFEEFLSTYPRMAGASDPPTEDPVPEPAVVQPPAPAPVPVNPGPWAADLEQYFADPNARAAADRYMRERVQPRITELEQVRSEHTMADQLYAELRKDPVNTFYAIAEELWDDDPDTVAALAQAIGLANPEEDPTVEDPTPQPPQLSPEQQQAIEYAMRKQQEDHYANLVEEARGQVEDAMGDKFADFFAPHVVIAEGDVDKAVASYNAWVNEAKTHFAPAETPKPKAEAPAVLGSDGTTTSQPATSKAYSSIEDALDDFFAEQKSAQPAPVGSV